MQRILFYILFTLISNLSISQAIRVAISDFENLSGNAKYDGLGKALSSMLISDIEINVSGKKIQLVERAQLNKIIKEQIPNTLLGVKCKIAVEAEAETNCYIPPPS